MNKMQIKLDKHSKLTCTATAIATAGAASHASRLKSNSMSFQNSRKTSIAPHHV